MTAHGLCPWTSLLLKAQFSFRLFLISFLAILTPHCCAWALCYSTSWGVLSSHCGGVSCCGAQALERGLSSCGPGARLPFSMWNPTSWTTDKTCGPCIAGKFSTNGPPGKSQFLLDSDMPVFSFCLNTLEIQSMFLNWVDVMGEFDSDDHYIYYCGKESLRRNGVAIMVNKRIWNAVLGCNLKNDRMISVCFQGKPFNITVIQAYAPTSNTE